MAASTWYTTDNEYIHWRIEATVNSQSIQNNTSSVTVRVFVARTNSYLPGTQGHGTTYATIDGASYSEYHNHTEEDIYITRSGLYMFTSTVTVPHNVDGTKSLTITANINYSRFTASSQTWTLTLPAIARATVPGLSAASAYMGTSITIDLPRALNTYTHNLKWKWGSASYQTIANNVATTYTWTVPDITTSLTTSAGTTYTVLAETYEGADLVGTQTATFTALVPASVVPTVSAPTVTELNAAVSAQFSVYIQTKSSLRVAINAAGAYGSTITDYSATFLGATYSGQTFDTPTINNAGTLPIAITVTDSRGRKTTATYNVTVVQLTPPQISTFSVQRCRLDHTPDDDGDYIAITVEYSVASLGGDNTATFTIGSQRLPDEASYTTFYTNNNTTLSTTIYPVPQFSSDYYWNFQASLEDYWTSGTPTTAVVQISSGAAIMDVNASGDGVAFGKVSERAGLDTAAGWPIRSGAGITAADGDITATSGDIVIQDATKGLKLPIGTIYGIQCGNLSIGSSATAVVFDYTFAHVPHIVASYSTTGTPASGNWEEIKIGSVATTGFTIQHGGTSGTRKATWVAIDIG